MMCCFTDVSSSGPEVQSQRLKILLLLLLLLQKGNSLNSGLIIDPLTLTFYGPLFIQCRQLGVFYIHPSLLFSFKRDDVDVSAVKKGHTHPIHLRMEDSRRRRRKRGKRGTWEFGPLNLRNWGCFQHHPVTRTNYAK